MGKRADGKRLVQIWMDDATIKRLDGLAAERKMSRSAVIADACERLLDKTPPESPAATHADIELLRRDLEASFASVAEAIKQQPISVQPAPEPPQLPDSDAWKDKSLIDRILRR